MKTAEEKANELYPNTKTSPFENQFRVAERKAFIKGVKYGKRQQVNSVDLADVVGRSEQLPCDCNKHPTYFDSKISKLSL